MFHFDLQFYKYLFLVGTKKKKQSNRNVGNGYFNQTIVECIPNRLENRDWRQGQGYALFQ